MKMSIAIALSLPLAICACNSAADFDLDNHIGINVSPEKSQAVKEGGVAYVEANVTNFLIPEKSEDEFAANREAAMNSVLPVYSANGFFPKDLLLVGPDADLDRAVRYSEVAIRRASEIGVKVMVLGSGRSRSIPDGFGREEAERQFLDLLKAIAPIAEKYGVVVAIEPLQSSESNFINTVRAGAELARKTGSDHIGVIADFFHMLREGEDAGAIIDSRDKLCHCHIAEKENRTPPGVDGDDFTPFFKALKEIGYTGGVSLECKWSDQEKQLPVAVETIRQQIISIK